MDEKQSVKPVVVILNCFCAVVWDFNVAWISYMVSRVNFHLSCILFVQ